MKTSVALCSYNGEHYISEQLESIVAQNVPVDEIVICDDGSRDKTCEIIRKFQRNTSIPIRLIQNPINLGYTRNFEKAICQCNGDIVFLADQDDIWLPDKVRTIVQYFETHPDKDFVFTDAELVNSIGTPCFHQTLFGILGWNEENKKLVDEGHAYELLSLSGRVTGATTALRISFVPYCLPFPKTTIPGVHDEMIAVTAAMRNRIGYIDQCLIRYRIHGDQSIGLGMLFRYKPKRWELSYDNLMWHEDLIDMYDSELSDKVHFVYKRFWTIRSRGSWIKLLKMYFKGEYSRHYPDPSNVLRRDLRGVTRRGLERIRLFPKYHVILKEDYYSI